jgi:hypothetical protein
MSKTEILHLGFVIFWILMIVPTLTIWQNSILLVLLMSLYANVEASATAFLSAKPKEKRKRPKIRGSVNVSHRGTRTQIQKRLLYTSVRRSKREKMY